MELVTRLYLIRPPLEFDTAARAAMQPLFERLGRRNLAAIVAAPGTASLAVSRALSELTSSAVRPLDARAQEDPVPVAVTLEALDQLAREFERTEVAVILESAGIRAALARALHVADVRRFAPEAGQAIALDWAHPDAREFQHALVGMGFDWDLAPAADKVHRFPGGASVAPRGS